MLKGLGNQLVECILLRLVLYMLCHVVAFFALEALHAVSCCY